MNVAIATVVIRRAEPAAAAAIAQVRVDSWRAQGATRLLTWVIAGNPGARKFYEGLGAEPLVEQPFERDGMNLVEAGYGWRHLPALAGAVALNP